MDGGGLILCLVSYTIPNTNPIIIIIKKILCPECNITPYHVHLNIFVNNAKINDESIIVLGIPHG
jgi:hypothetical protein